MFSKEEQLLITCARLEMSDIQRELLIGLLSYGDLPWPNILQKARWHRLSGLLFRHLNSIELADLVPSQTMEECRNAYLHTTARNLYMRSQLKRGLATLQEKSIPVIVLKGMALLEHVYSSVGLRPMSDIDIMVPENRAEEAQSAIQALGYYPVGTPNSQENTRKVHRHLPSLRHVGQDAVFEVHSHIVSRDSPLRFEIANFWNLAKDTSISGLSAKVLAPEHMLIHLAIHFFLDRRFHSSAALGQLCDMAELARYFQTEFDWDLFLEEVVTHGVEGPVYCGISLAKQLLDALIPEAVLGKLQPPGYSTPSAERFMRRRVLDTRPVLASSLVKPASVYSFPTLARNIITRLFPNRTYMANHYPAVVHSQGLRRAYIDRLAQASSVLAQYIRGPGELWQQFQVDRWIHTIQNGSQNGTSKYPTNANSSDS